MFKNSVQSGHISKLITVFEYMSASFELEQLFPRALLIIALKQTIFDQFLSFISDKVKNYLFFGDLNQQKTLVVVHEPFASSGRRRRTENLERPCRKDPVACFSAFWRDFSSICRNYKINRDPFLLNALCEEERLSWKQLKKSKLKKKKLTENWRIFLTPLVSPQKCHWDIFLPKKRWKKNKNNNGKCSFVPFCA